MPKQLETATRDRDGRAGRCVSACGRLGMGRVERSNERAREPKDAPSTPLNTAGTNCLLLGKLQSLKRSDAETGRSSRGVPVCLRLGTVGTDEATQATRRQAMRAKVKKDSPGTLRIGPDTAVHNLLRRRVRPVCCRCNRRHARGVGMTVLGKRCRG